MLFIDTMRSYLSGSEPTVSECRHCGTTVEPDVERCPHCEAESIVRYRVT